MAFEELLGKIITGVWLYNNDTEIRFDTSDGGTHWYVTEADCCNNVWFNHIAGINNLIGHTVISIDERIEALEDPQDMVGSDDAEDILLWVLKTEAGYCDLEVRNSHNGYYSGNVRSRGIPSNTDPIWDEGVLIYKDF